MITLKMTVNIPSVSFRRLIRNLPERPRYLTSCNVSNASCKAFFRSIDILQTVRHLFCNVSTRGLYPSRSFSFMLLIKDGEINTTAKKTSINISVVTLFGYTTHLPKWRPGDLGSRVNILVSLSTSLFLLVTSS